jgi:uncharacterized protein
MTTSNSRVTETVFASPVGNRTKPQHPVATGCGLAIALFAIPAFVAGYRLVNGESRSDLQVVVREIAILVIVALLLWLVKTQESLPLTSVGLHLERWGRSVLRGCVLALATLLVTIGLYFLLRQFGIHLGESAGGSFHPSLWVVTLVTLRAGIAEELFYRGYAVERLQSLTGNTWLAGIIPLMVFAAAHYRQGLGGIIAAFVLGGIATLFYLKFRDLIANATGHTLADFVLNVALPLLSGG